MTAIKPFSSVLMHISKYRIGNYPKLLEVQKGTETFLKKLNKYTLSTLLVSPKITLKSADIPQRKPMFLIKKCIYLWAL